MPNISLIMAGFKVYERKSSVTLLLKYKPGMSLEGVSVSTRDVALLETEPFWIASNPSNLEDKWLVPGSYVMATFQSTPVFGTIEDGLFQRKSSVSFLRPYVPGEDLAGVDLSPSDIDEGWTEKPGSFIAIDPLDLERMWFVNAAYAQSVFHDEPLVG